MSDMIDRFILWAKAWTGIFFGAICRRINQATQKTTWGLCRKIAMSPTHRRDPLRCEGYMGEFHKAMDYIYIYTYKDPCWSAPNILDVSFGCGPLPETAITRIVTCLVGRTKSSCTTGILGGCHTQCILPILCILCFLIFNSTSGARWCWTWERRISVVWTPARRWAVGIGWNVGNWRKWPATNLWNTLLGFIGYIINTPIWGWNFHGWFHHQPDVFKSLCLRMIRTSRWHFSIYMLKRIWLGPRTTSWTVVDPYGLFAIERADKLLAREFPT